MHFLMVTLSPRKDLYILLIEGQSFISFNIQVHLNMSDLDPPILFNMDSIFSRACKVSASIPPLQLHHFQMFQFVQIHK